MWERSIVKNGKHVKGLKLEIKNNMPLFSGVEAIHSKNVHTFNWRAFPRKFHLILSFPFLGMMLILNQVTSFTFLTNYDLKTIQLWWPAVPFFRNFTPQIKTFPGYYDKRQKQKTKNKQANKQCSWEPRPTVHFSDEREN